MGSDVLAVDFGRVPKRFREKAKRILEPVEFFAGVAAELEDELKLHDQERGRVSAERSSSIFKVTIVELVSLSA